MPDHERAMLAYVNLAAISSQKRQLAGRDRFLILAGAAACRAGWLDVAERCRQLVLDHNGRHQVGRSASFADAMRSADFLQYLRQQERFCGYERAEFLLRELGIDAAAPAGVDAGTHALGLLETAGSREP